MLAGALVKRAPAGAGAAPASAKPKSGTPVPQTPHVRVPAGSASPQMWQLAMGALRVRRLRLRARPARETFPARGGREAASGSEIDVLRHHDLLRPRRRRQ